MNRISKTLTVLGLLGLLLLTFAAPAQAFEGRGGEKITIAADEVIDDDLYVSAAEFVLEGTVNGDLIVVGQAITVNGTVNGDLIAAGQQISVGGAIADDVRMAASVMRIGEEASIGGDVVAAGFSLETRPGSTVGQDMIFAGGQVLLAGDIARNVGVATGGLDLRGTVGGDVKADVADTDEQAGPPPNMFMPQVTIPVPSVDPGLTIDPSASIGGNLEYTQSKDLAIPGGVVDGEITRSEPPTEEGAPALTPAQLAGNWAFDWLRGIVTLILFGLLLAWLAPTFLSGLSDKLAGKPLPSLGWGAVAWAAFFFAILVVVVVMIVGGLVFGTLTLGAVSGTIIWLGILALFALGLGFVLVTSFVTKVVVGAVVGKLILARANPSLAEHRFWPVVIGAGLVALVLGLLQFPLLPLGVLYVLLDLAVILLGLGALWLWGRERFRKQPAG